jgi:hypothetical protein
MISTTSTSLSLLKALSLALRQPAPNPKAKTPLLTMLLPACSQESLPIQQALWDEAHTLVKPEQGLLVLDDTTLETSLMRARWSWYITTGVASIEG